MESAPQKTLSRISRRIGPFLLVFLLVVQAGCGHVSPARNGRTSQVPGTVGIVTAGFLPEVRLDLPGKGRVDGALRGAGRGFLTGAEVPLRILADGMSGCSGQACGYAVIGLLAAATAAGTVGGIVGGVHGAIKAMPAREARKIEEATQGLADLRIQEIMTDRVLEAETESGTCRYILLPDESWSAPEGEADYNSLAGEGFDSIIEIGVVSMGFKGTQWGSDPPLSVFLTVRVRRYDGKNGKLLGVEDLAYESGEQKFAEWMADGAVPAEEEFEQGYLEIADKIVGTIPCD